MLRINIIYKVVHTTGGGIFSSSKLQRKCLLKREDFNEARKRILAERLRRASSPAPVTSAKKVANGDGSNKNDKVEPTKSKNRGKNNGYAKLAAENSKDLIAWITSGVVSGTIVLMIMTACAIHYFKYKYENIFVSRMQRQESIQEQQSVNNIQMFPKQQAVVYIPEQQLTKVVNL